MPYFGVSDGVGNYGMTFSQTPDSTQREIMGLIVEAIDPVWGGGELIYLRAASAIRQYGLCVWTATATSASTQMVISASECPNTANLGRSVCVALSSMAAGDYGWFVISGTTPVACSASVSAGTAFGITGAGQVGAIANGKQILNAITSLPSTTTIVKKNCIGYSGSNILTVTNSDGWFVGAALSGTGVAASTTITSIDPSGKIVTMNNAASAAISGDVTATFTNFNIITCNRPFAQGQIT